MKTGLTSLLLALCLAATAQKNDLARQLQLVLRDVPAGFREFRQQPLLAGNSDTTWTSALTLPGTGENQVRKNSKGASYAALIAADLSAELAENLLQTWKTQLTEATSLRAETVLPEKANPRYGFRFPWRKDGIAADLLLSVVPNGSFSNVVLQVESR